MRSSSVAGFADVPENVSLRAMSSTGVTGLRHTGNSGFLHIHAVRHLLSFGALDGHLDLKAFGAGISQPTPLGRDRLIAPPNVLD